MILSHLCTREAPLLSILRRELALSSGLVKRLKWQDALLLNGVPVHTNARVRPGDRVTVDLSETVVGYEGEDVPLYEEGGFPLRRGRADEGIGPYNRCGGDGRPMVAPTFTTSSAIESVGAGIARPQRLHKIRGLSFWRVM